MSCTNGSCYQPDCPRCGPTMGTLRMSRAAGRYPYQPPPSGSPWPMRVLARYPRLVGILTQKPVKREVMQPDRLLMSRIKRMLPDRHEIAVSETRGIIGTVEK